MADNRVYSTFASSLITVSIRWTDRLIGVISTIVLARLLLAEDFGVIAMASLIITLADVLLNFGVHVALIRDPGATKEHFDTAWTIRLLQSLVSTIVLVLCAPLASSYFHDPRVEPVVRVLAMSPLLGGLENIGLIQFQKNMEFGAEFRFIFLRRFSGFVVTIVTAMMLRSYWALVIGTLTGQVIGIVLSYMLHPMRPRFSLREFRDIFSISQWMLFANIGTYLRNNLHRFLVGRWASTATMGAYTIADEIAAMPGAELLAPINRALFPAFAKLKDDLQALKEKLLLAQGVQTLLVVPAAVGVALVADEAVLLLLGDRWQPAIDFVQVLVLVSIAQSLTSSGSHVLLVLGKIRANVAYVWSQVLLFAVLSVTVFFRSEAISIAWLRLLVAGLGLCFLFWLLIRALPILRPSEIIRTSARPLIAAAIMALVLMGPLGRLEFPLVVQLGTKMLVGAITYATSVFALWLATGRAPGAESYCFGKTAEIVGTLTRSRG